MSDKPGRDLGRRIMASLRGYMARSLGEINARFESFQIALDNTQMQTLELLRGEIDASIDRRMPARPDMAAIVDALWPRIEAHFAKWELDFDRRADSKFERAIDRMPRPQDGVDGEDGGSVDDFDIAIDGRALTVVMKIGERVERRTVRLDIPIYRDVYQSGKEYERGDMVTYAGSVFIAKRDVTGKEKPEASDVWKLAIKRGRDGKDPNEGGQ